jgi:hypothetical protein
MKATGKKPPDFKFPFWLLKLLNAEMASHLHWNNEVGCHVDIQVLRQIHRDLTSLDKFWQAHQATA